MASNIASDLQSYLSSSQKNLPGSRSSNGSFISLNLPTFAGYSKLSQASSDNPFDEEAQTSSSASKSSGWLAWTGLGAEKQEEPKIACLPEMSRKQRLTGSLLPYTCKPFCRISFNLSETCERCAHVFFGCEVFSITLNE